VGVSANFRRAKILNIDAHFSGAKESLVGTMFSGDREEKTVREEI
jgi:hypothetical protein